MSSFPRTTGETAQLPRPSRTRPSRRHRHWPGAELRSAIQLALVDIQTSADRAQLIRHTVNTTLNVAEVERATIADEITWAQNVPIDLR